MWLQLKSGDFEQTYLARPIAQSTAREYCNNEDVALYSRKDGIVAQEACVGFQPKKHLSGLGHKPEL